MFKNYLFTNFWIKSFLSLSFLFLSSCQITPIGELGQDEGINRIREDHSDGSWSSVIENVDEFKTRYPYSKFNVEADLIQADAYYMAGRYPEAIAAYEDFLRKNPNHSSVNLAHYRIAKSYDFQASDSIDREFLNAKKAIAKYGYFLREYSKDENIKDVEERVLILNRRLADHEAFIARFYWNKDMYSASLLRYLNILENYSQYNDLKNESLSRAVICYEKLADILEKDPKSDLFIQFKNMSAKDLRAKANDLKNKK